LAIAALQDALAPAKLASSQEVFSAALQLPSLYNCGFYVLAWMRGLCDFAALAPDLMPTRQDWILPPLDSPQANAFRGAVVAEVFVNQLLCPAAVVDADAFGGMDDQRDQIARFIIQLSSAAASAAPVDPHSAAALPSLHAPLPSKLASPEQPLVTASRKQPSALASHEQPAALASTEQPLATASTEQPLVTASTEQPLVTASREQPSALTSREQPLVSASAGLLPTHPSHWEHDLAEARSVRSAQLQVFFIFVFLQFAFTPTQVVVAQRSIALGT
jgi:hypothetical protein